MTPVTKFNKAFNICFTVYRNYKRGERETETERARDRDRDTQRDRERVRDRERQTDRDNVQHFLDETCLLQL